MLAWITRCFRVTADARPRAGFNGPGVTLGESNRPVNTSKVLLIARGWRARDTVDCRHGWNEAVDFARHRGGEMGANGRFRPSPNVVWVAVAGVSAALAAWALWRAGVAREALRELVQAQTVPIRPVPAVGDPYASSAFLSLLDPSPSPAIFLAKLDQVSTSAAVVVVGVAIADHPASESELGRHDYALGLRGGYTPVKQAIADLLVASGGATLRSLTIRRDTSSGSVDVSAVIAVWRRPLSEPGAQGRHQRAGR